MFRLTPLASFAVLGALASSACRGESGNGIGQRGTAETREAGVLPPVVLGFPWVLVNDVVNARDVGSVLVDMSHGVGRESLYRGPTLAGLEADGCAEIGRLRIRTVVDLRIDTERESTPETPCVTDQANVVLAPLPVPYDVSPQNYVDIVRSSEPMATAFRVLASYESYPVYVHCTYGRDRTGVFVGLVLAALGVEREAILREYSLSEQFVGAYPASMEAAFGEVDRLGGIESYLASIGIGLPELNVLRRKLSVSFD